MIRRRTTALNLTKRKKNKTTTAINQKPKKTTVEATTEVKVSILNKDNKDIRYINTGSELLLLHFFDLKNASLKELLTNNNDDIGIDILYTYAKLLDLDTSELFNYEEIKSSISDISDISNTSGRAKKRVKLTQGGAINLQINDKVINGFLKYQYIFDNKHDFNKVLDANSKKYLYSTDEISSADLPTKNSLQELSVKDDRFIFFDLLQRHFEIVRKISYINFDSVDLLQSQIAQRAERIEPATVQAANITNYLEQTLKIANAKYMTDGKLMIKTYNDTTPAEKTYNTVVSSVNKYLSLNAIYTLENCFDSLSVNRDEIYKLFEQTNFKNNIEIYAGISEEIFDFSVSMLPPTVDKSIFKAFKEETSRLFDVAYYIDTDNNYKTALIFKQTRIINSLGVLSPDIFKLVKVAGSSVYQKVAATATTTTIKYYAIDLINIRSFNSPKNISKFISNDFNITSQINKNIGIVYKYVYEYYKSISSPTTLNDIKIKTAYTLFDLKKAGDMCKMLFSFYFNFIKERTPSVITNIGIQTLGFSSNDKLAALNSIFKQSNNVFFGDKTTNTLYVYNNDNGDFNMNILVLWINKYFCLDTYKLDFSIGDIASFDIIELVEIYNDINRVFSIDSKEITSKINAKLFPLYTNKTLDSVNFTTMTSNRKRFNYDIYLRVLLLRTLTIVQNHITENLTDTDNNNIFVKILFKDIDDPNYNPLLNTIVKTLFKSITTDIKAIFDDIKIKIILNKTIEITKADVFYDILSIINNILMIVNIFLYVHDKTEVKVFNKLNEIKENLSALFLTKYPPPTKKQTRRNATDMAIEFENRIEQDKQLKTSLFNSVKKKVEDIRYNNKKSKVEEKKTTGKTKATKKSKEDIPTFIISDSEITAYINNFIVNNSIINFIMTFNNYYNFFNNLLNYLEKNANGLNSLLIKDFINKIKLIYFYIYIQLYTENKTLLKIDPDMKISEYYENILISIIKSLSDPINIIFSIPIDEPVGGIEKQAKEEIEQEQKIMNELRERFKEGFINKIEILKNNVKTLNVLNYNGNYTINSLNNIVLSKDEVIPGLTATDIKKLNNLFEQNKEIDINKPSTSTSGDKTGLLLEPLKLKHKKLLNIYNFFLFDKTPIIIPNSASIKLSSNSLLPQQPQPITMGGSYKKQMKKYYN